MCPRCDRPVRVPLHFDPEDESALGAVDFVEEEPLPLPRSTHFGVASLALAAVSVIVLCIPVIGYYGSLALSGLGLLVGLIGLVTYKAPDEDPRDRRRSRPHQELLGVDLYARGFPWLGILACLVGIALTVLPFVREWHAPK
jgi:hypothetical protein